MKIHKSAEDYLETILILQTELGQVRSIDIVNQLGFSKPSVSIAMKKLREVNYITVDHEGYIELTPNGLEIANQVYNKHKILTDFFIRIGVTKKQASEDACKIEHDLSEETFEKLKLYILNSN